MAPALIPAHCRASSKFPEPGSSPACVHYTKKGAGKECCWRTGNFSGREGTGNKADFEAEHPKEQAHMSLRSSIHSVPTGTGDSKEGLGSRGRAVTMTARR